jgi:hypothetical protein
MYKIVNALYLIINLKLINNQHKNNKILNNLNKIKMVLIVVMYVVLNYN